MRKIVSMTLAPSVCFERERALPEECVKEPILLLQFPKKSLSPLMKLCDVVHFFLL